MFFQTPQHRVARFIGWGRDWTTMCDHLNRVFGFATFFTVEAFDGWTDADCKEFAKIVRQRGGVI
jgi:hypothetical protein